MKAIAIFGGFTEDDFDTTGSRRIYNELSIRYGATHLVEFAEWHEGKQLAEYLTREGVSEALVGAYSWGAGQGLRDLSKGFTGQIKAILCDPVYRSPFPWMRWRALTKWWVPTIYYGDNVEVIGWFNQVMDQPGADKVKAKMMPDKPKVLPFPHTQIDDSPQYAKAMLDAAKEFTQ